MKICLSFLTCLIIMLGAVGCATLESDVTPLSLEVALSEETFGGEMLQALKDQQYTDFIQHFTRELRETVPEGAFQKMSTDIHTKNGSIQSWKFLDVLNRGGLYRTELWKVTLQRFDSKGNVQLLERLFYVTVAQMADAEVVIGFRFDTLF